MAQDNSWTIESVFFYFIKKVNSFIFRNSDFVFIDIKKLAHNYLKCRFI